jgi:hypothetical protein
MYENECTRLHKLVNDLPRHSFADLSGLFPTDGVYFLFESGETGHGRERIVYVGGHTGKDNLEPRLREHLRPNKDRSIFRKHIGRAILQQSNDPYLDVWNIDCTTKKAREDRGHQIDKVKQAAIENAVTQRIETNFFVAVLGTNASVDARKFRESCIGTVSSCTNCNPTKDWLGRHADPRIALSGLWQIQHLYGNGFADTILAERFRLSR